MQDGKTGGSRWVPDIREDEITEFQEQNGDETATYKAVNVHPIISRVLDKLAFFRTHVSAVWYNKLANKTVKDKLDEIDTSISSLNSNYGENENGSYLRLPDGTQLCWLNTIVTDQAINTLYTSGVYQGIRNWTFPIPFIDSPSVSCGCFRHGTGASWGAVNASTPTEAGLRAYDFVSREAGSTCLIQAIAIGRWKS